jgi:hypothetical protein
MLEISIAAMGALIGIEKAAKRLQMWADIAKSVAEIRAVEVNFQGSEPKGNV